MFWVSSLCWHVCGSVRTFGVNMDIAITVNVLKFRNTKLSNKMTYANSADPDQTAPEGAV